MSSMNNFDRNVWCLLGLPFDAVSMNETIELVHNAAKNKKPLFLSTPNLNFLISSQKDENFRNSVINSDLSIMDGRPLVWLSRLLRIPIPEQVAGSSLIEKLIENKEGYKKLKVFFFGGEEGIAKQACTRLNFQKSGMECVGFYNPGFGTLEEMSELETINIINMTNADFIIVSLGAKKGQSWIEKNKDKINAPVICHLGAVVNFIAESVNRSPKLLQRLGMEWLWRIKEEPALWRRYLSDGFSLIYIFINKVLPYRFFILAHEKKSKGKSSTIKIEENNETLLVTISGHLGWHGDRKFNEIMELLFSTNKRINIVIDKNSYIDSMFIGKIFELRKNIHKSGNSIEIFTCSKKIRKIFHYNSCEYLLETNGI